MESKSNAGQDQLADTAVDPAADLRLLDRAQAATGLDQALDVGPWWYTPLYAAGIGGITLFAQDMTGVWSVVAGLVGIVALGIVMIHYQRHRTLRARQSARTFLPTLVIVVVVWAVCALWGTAISVIGYDRFVPGYAALAWLITTGVLLAGRAVLLAVRRRRTPLLS